MRSTASFVKPCFKTKEMCTSECPIWSKNGHETFIDPTNIHQNNNTGVVLHPTSMDDKSKTSKKNTLYQHVLAPWKCKISSTYQALQRTARPSVCWLRCIAASQWPLGHAYPAKLIWQPSSERSLWDPMGPMGGAIGATTWRAQGGPNGLNGPPGPCGINTSQKNKI